MLTLEKINLHHNYILKWVCVDTLKIISESVNEHYLVFQEVEQGTKVWSQESVQDEISVWFKSSVPLANLLVLCYHWGLIKLPIKQCVSVCQCPLFENLVSCLAACCLVLGVGTIPLWTWLPVLCCAIIWILLYRGYRYILMVCIGWTEKELYSPTVVTASSEREREREREMSCSIGHKSEPDSFCLVILLSL